MEIQMTNEEIATQAEEFIGRNVVFLTDLHDLKIRQQDEETLQRIREFHEGWKLLVRLTDRLKVGINYEKGKAMPEGK